MQAVFTVQNGDALVYDPRAEPAPDAEPDRGFGWLCVREERNREEKRGSSERGLDPPRLVEDPHQCTSACAKNLQTILGIAMKCGDTPAPRPRRTRAEK